MFTASDVGELLSQVRVQDHDENVGARGVLLRMLAAHATAEVVLGAKVVGVSARRVEPELGLAL